MHRVFLLLPAQHLLDLCTSSRERRPDIGRCLFCIYFTKRSKHSQSLQRYSARDHRCSVAPKNEELHENAQDTTHVLQNFFLLHRCFNSQLCHECQHDEQHSAHLDDAVEGSTMGFRRRGRLTVYSHILLFRERRGADLPGVDGHKKNTHTHAQCATERSAAQRNHDMGRRRRSEMAAGIGTSVVASVKLENGAFCATSDRGRQKSLSLHQSRAR